MPTTGPRSTFSVVVQSGLALALLLALSGPAAAAGGVSLAKHDNGGSDGWCSPFSNGQDMNFWAIRYNAHELDPTAVICQGHAFIYNFQNTTDPSSANYEPRDLSTTMDLRSEDPLNPGFPDISSAGVLATAGSTIIRPGYTNHYGQFNYAPDPGQTIFLTWTEPLSTSTSGLALCTMLDVNNPRGSSNDSRSVTAAGTTGLNPTWDYIGSIFVAHTRPANMRLLTRGSQRFAGDRGLPLVFTRRPNAGPVPETDDFIYFDAVVDNNGSSPVTANLAIQVDRNVFTGGSPVWRDITNFFSPRIVNPMVFPPGRTIVTSRITRAVKSRFLALFPVNIPARALLTDPDTSALVDGEPGVWGLRPSPGEFDAATDDVAFIVRSPAFTNDSVAVRYHAYDMPKVGYVISGIGVASVEVGGSGLPGFDAIELRAEDPVTGFPDKSAAGLLRSVGIVDAVAEVSIGGTGGTIVDAAFDTIDVFVDSRFGESGHLWVEIFFGPGDGAANGTLVMADNRAATRLPNTYFTERSANYVRLRDFSIQNYNAQIRILTDGRFRTLESSPPRRARGAVPRFLTELANPVPRLVRAGETRLPR